MLTEKQMIMMKPRLLKLNRQITHRPVPSGQARTLDNPTTQDKVLRLPVGNKCLGTTIQLGSVTF